MKDLILELFETYTYQTKMGSDGVASTETIDTISSEDFDELADDLIKLFKNNS